MLPQAVTEQLDFSSLKLVPASFVDAEMEHRHADLLFAIRLAGHPSYIYVLFEHQSEPDALMPWRVLGHQQRIWTSILRAEPGRRTLPPIITIVVHHGAAGWTAPRSLGACIDGLDQLPELRAFVPAFELLIDDLQSVADEALQERALRSFPKITLWLLRDGRDITELIAHLAAWGDELERLVRDAPNREDVAVVLRYILRVAGEMPYETVRHRIAEVAPALEEVMASAEQQLIEKGIEKGIGKGMQRALVRQLRARFGGLDPAVEMRIGRASPDELDRWVERVLVADTIDDVFDGR